MMDSLPAVHDGADIPSDIDDVDLNSLALFHSSVPSNSFASQSTTIAAASFLPASQASDAVIWDGPMLLSSADKPRRHRDRQAPSSDMSLSTVEAAPWKEKRKHKRHRSDKTNNEIPDSYHQTTVAPCLDQHFLPMASAGANTVPSSDPVHDGASSIDDDKVEPSAVCKKKRKHSDSISGKRQKKRRSYHQAHPREQEAQEDVVTLTPPADLTQSARDTGPTGDGDGDGVVQEEQVNATNPNNSSTAARIAYHSLSCHVDVPESSLVRSEPGLAEVDLGTDVGATEKRVDFANADVEALARTTFAEHRNDQSSLAKSRSPTGSPAAPDVEEIDPSPSMRTRPTRKRAKPTFFDSPAAQAPIDVQGGNGEALKEMPSPKALTPKPRKRAKVAAQKTAKGKKPKPERLPLPPGPEEAENVEEEMVSRPARRNRLAGFTQGRFTDEELARIARAVEDFRGQHDLTQQEVNHMIHAPGGTTAGDAHAQLWSRVFAECPNRQRQKIINITRKKFHNFVARATWTAEQDAELSELVMVHGRQWSKIAAIVNRHPEDLRDRYRNYLVCGQNQRKDTWDDDEELRLTQEVIIAMRDVDELRRQPDKSHLLNCSYEELIDWQLISERMNRTRSRLQCITKWKSLNFRTHGKDRLVSSQPDANISFRLEKARRQIAAIPDEEKFRLILAIQATGVGKDSKIPWQRLVDKKFRNQWHRSTQMLLWRRLRQSIPGLEAKTTRDTALILVEQYNQSGQLPEVDGDSFDDAQEMDFIQSLPASFSGVNTTATADQGKSAEHVVDSEADEPQTEANGNAAEATVADNLEIDPALTETPLAAKRMATAKKTGSGRPPSKKKAKVAPMALMDPIEDGGNTASSGADDDGLTDATQP